MHHEWLARGACRAWHVKKARKQHKVEKRFQAWGDTWQVMALGGGGGMEGLVSDGATQSSSESAGENHGN